MHCTLEKGILYIHKVDSKVLLELRQRLKVLRYDRINRIVSTRYDKRLLNVLDTLGCDIPDYIRQGMSLEMLMQKRYLQAKVPSHIKSGLFDYQIDGVKRLIAGYSLLADVMGLGKTITAISFLKIVHVRRSVVVCPAFLKEKWKYEIEKWSDFRPTIINGQREIGLKRRGIFIINYDILQHHLKELTEYRIDLIIADEFHLCKNDASLRTKAVRQIVGVSKRFVALTGTPILNNASELYPVLNMIDKYHFYSRTMFESDFVIKKQNRIVGTKNHDKLYRELSKSIMVRRTYDEVKKQINHKTIIDSQIVPIRLKSYEEYNFASSNLETYAFQKYNKIYGESIILQRPRILKEIIYENKKEQIFEWLDNFLLEKEKITLFFTRTKHLEEFAQRYNARTIYGKTPTKDRLNIVNDFNKNDELVLCCNIRAAGVGLDIVGCHNTGFVDLDDVWENMNQAIKRFDRIGQQSPVVSVYYFLGLNTIEDSAIINKLDKKHDTAKRVIDGRKLRNNEKIRR